MPQISKTEDQGVLWVMGLIEGACKAIGFDDYQILTYEEAKGLCRGLPEKTDIYFGFDGAVNEFYNDPPNTLAEALIGKIQAMYPDAWYEFIYHWNMAIYLEKEPAKEKIVW